MNKNVQVLLCAIVALLVTKFAAGIDQPASPFEKAPQLRALPSAEVQQQVMSWLDAVQASDEVRQAVLELWSRTGNAHGADLLELAASSFALVDTRAAGIVELCRQTYHEPLLADHSWLADDGPPDFLRANLRLYYGRWLAQHRLYEESNEHLAGLTPEQVIDPAPLLFYQAVNHHRLLQRDAGLKTIRRLLDDVAEVPQRYQAVARLMEADLKGLEDESLDHIARRMEDIRRRLDLGRAGQKTREVEDGVIASLDKLIDEMEQQQQQQQQQQASSGGSNSPAMPAQDSRILGGSGPGQTNKRDLGQPADWGLLPPKQRQEALQQIGKDFPSHYRDVVEEYFRKLATQPQGD
jgi:hypothetical protein